MEALHYKKLANKRVKCLLCPHHCVINNQEVGKCRVRKNRNGTLISEVYGALSAANLDPIEKKPLYHFHPGMEILSIGSLGCNFTCECCQNYHISQSGTESFPRLMNMKPVDIVELAQNSIGNIGVAYTYNEPTVWFEQMLDTASLVKEKGMHNVMVSNAYINAKPLKELLPFFDAFNIDLKSMDRRKHKEFTNGELMPVLNNLQKIKKSGKHLELTSLIVPELNDTEKQMKTLIRWVRRNLGRDVPLHLSRYFPRYKYNMDTTSADLLINFANLASEDLYYVYVGNLPIKQFQNTNCPKCKKVTILRHGYNTEKVGLTESGNCIYCGMNIVIN